MSKHHRPHTSNPPPPVQIAATAVANISRAAEQKLPETPLPPAPPEKKVKGWRVVERANVWFDGANVTANEGKIVRDPRMYEMYSAQGVKFEEVT